MTGSLKVAVSLSHVEPLIGADYAQLPALAQMAEAAGADSLTMSEHVALQGVIDGHPGDQPFPFPPDEEYPEPLVTLASVIPVTTTVTLGTNILVAPLRPAPLLAKMVATLDALSGGRVELGVGAGWHEPELTASGVPPAEAEARLDDIVGACRALWTGQPASYASGTVTFDALYCRPRPIRGAVPLWFGGGATRRMARRVADWGIGWSPMGGTDPAVIRRGMDRIAAACAAAGRDPAAVGLRCMLTPSRDAAGACDVDGLVGQVGPLRQVGMTTVQLPSLPSLAGKVDELEPVLAEVIGRIKGLVDT